MFTKLRFSCLALVLVAAFGVRCSLGSDCYVWSESRSCYDEYGPAGTDTICNCAGIEEGCDSSHSDYYFTANSNYTTKWKQVTSAQGAGQHATNSPKFCEVLRYCGGCVIGPTGSLVCQDQGLLHEYKVDNWTLYGSCSGGYPH